MLFTCAINRKIVSICRQERGQPMYRFGIPGHVELEGSTLHFARTGFSGGGEDQVQVDTPTHRYIVYTEIHRTAFGADGLHDPKSSAGLIVQEQGRTISSRKCAVDATFHEQTEALVPAGEYVPH